MTHETPGERWLRKYTSERDTLIEANAYNPADEKDSCGVGLVAQIDGTPRREIVEMAVRALKTGPVPSVARHGRSCSVCVTFTPSESNTRLLRASFSVPLIPVTLNRRL